MADKEEKLKKYNLSQVAEILDVPRQTVYYWIKKEWIKPKRDSRQYPFFTVFDMEKIIKWRDKVNFDKLNREFSNKP